MKQKYQISETLENSWTMKELIYIYVGKYKRNSGGNHALLLLSEKLQKDGYEVWHSSYSILFNKISMFSNELTFSTILRHRWEGFDPIVIYPESIPYNVLGAKRPVWFLMSQPGEIFDIGDEVKLWENRATFCYSENIKKNWNSNGPVIHVPAVDFLELQSLPLAEKTVDEMIYTGKYMDFYRQEIPGSLVEIPRLTRSTAGESRVEFLTQLSRAKVVHCFENSAVAMEALVLGAQVIFHFNPYFRSLILEGTCAIFARHFRLGNVNGCLVSGANS